MGNSFENAASTRGAAGQERSRREEEKVNPDLEAIAKIPEQLRRFADEFAEAIEPTIALDKKGDKANWIDTANALYAAGKFALPRIKRGMDLLDQYLQTKK